MLGRGQRNTDSHPRESRVDRTGDESRTRVFGYKQDHQTRWTDYGWVETDSFAPDTVQLTGRKRRAGGRSAVKRIPDGTVLRRDNQWGIPRKRGLFLSDGPDSTTSGSDILEGHYEEGYSDVHSTGHSGLFSCVGNSY